MTFTFNVAEKWKLRISEGGPQGGTARLQIVTAKAILAIMSCSRDLLTNKIPSCSASPARREVMVCSPEDALNMFYGSALENLHRRFGQEI
jgi:carbamoyltransferase